MKVKKVKKKYVHHLLQVAFGITDIYANPDFFKMMKYSREKGVIPNYTTHGLDVDNYAVDFTAKNCGAVAVSVSSRPVKIRMRRKKCKNVNMDVEKKENIS